MSYTAQKHVAVSMALCALLPHTYPGSRNNRGQVSVSVVWYVLLGHTYLESWDDRQSLLCSLEQISTKNIFIDSLEPSTSIGIRIKPQLLMSAIFKDALERPIFCVIGTPYAVTRVKKVSLMYSNTDLVVY